MIVLDFDRVLFDTDGLIDFIDEHGLQDIKRGSELEKALDEAGFDWESCVLPGVGEFLSQRDDCQIVTSAFSRTRKDNEDPESAALFQKIKLTRSGIGKLVSDKYDITGESKEAELSKYAEEGALILDDEMEHLQVAEKLGYKTIWFRTKHNLKKSLEGNPLEYEYIADGMVTSFERFVALEKEWLTETL